MMVTMIFLFSLLSSYTDDETHARQITIVRCTRAKTEENDDDDNDDYDDDDNALFTFNEHRAENYRSLMATAFSYLTTTN